MAIFRSEVDRYELERRLQKDWRISEDVIQKVLRGQRVDTNDLLNVREHLERQGLREGRDFNWEGD